MKYYIVNKVTSFLMNYWFLLKCRGVFLVMTMYILLKNKGNVGDSASQTRAQWVPYKRSGGSPIANVSDWRTRRRGFDPDHYTNDLNTLLTQTF